MKNLKRFTNLALILLVVGVWVTVAHEHEFAENGRVDAAPIEDSASRNYKTATFALG